MFTVLRMSRQVTGPGNVPVPGQRQVCCQTLVMEGTRQACFASALAQIEEGWGSAGSASSGTVDFFYCEPDDPHPPAITQPETLYSSGPAGPGSVGSGQNRG